jgi:GTP cyclohydrolase I
MNDNILKEVEKHIKAISDLLEIPETASSIDTPKRVAKMYCNELFKNRNNNNIAELDEKMKLFEAINDSPIKVRGIDFHSTCEHHWLPFSGVCNVEYIPSKKIVGLSKIPRVVKYFSQKPQLQERLTHEIGEYLFNLLRPRFIRVEMIAEHCCVACRGAESDCDTITEYTNGYIPRKGYL